MPVFKQPGDLVFLRAVEVDEDFNEVDGGVVKNLIYDKGTEKYVYTDPNRGPDHLREVKAELYKRRTAGVSQSRR